MTVHRGPLPYDLGPEGAAITAAAMGATSVNNGSGESKWVAPGRKGGAGDLCVAYIGQRNTWTDLAYGTDEWWAGWIYLEERPLEPLTISEYRAAGGAVQAALEFGTAGKLRVTAGSTALDETADDLAAQWVWAQWNVKQATTSQALEIWLPDGTLYDTLTGAVNLAAIVRHREGRMGDDATGTLLVDEGQLQTTEPSTTFVPILVSAWVGDWTKNGFAVVTKTSGATLTRMVVKRFGATIVTSANQTPDADGYARHVFSTGLPKTGYDYRIEGNDGVAWADIGGNAP